MPTLLTGRLGLQAAPLPHPPPAALPTSHPSPSGPVWSPACLTGPPAFLGMLFVIATDPRAVVTATPSVSVRRVVLEIPYFPHVTRAPLLTITHHGNPTKPLFRSQQTLGLATPRGTP